MRGWLTLKQQVQNIHISGSCGFLKAFAIVDIHINPMAQELEN
jgi:hypothetical protein